MRFILKITVLGLGLGLGAASLQKGGPLAWASESKAPAAVETHEEKPLHGGYFGDAGNLYHYEVVLDPHRTVRLYLYDETAQPMKVTGIPARWTLSPDDSDPVRGEFQEGKQGEFYRAEVPRPVGSVLHLKVEARRKEEWVPMEFFIPLQ